jgi:hypothetical protein
LAFRELPANALPACPMSSICPRIARTSLPRRSAGSEIGGDGFRRARGMGTVRVRVNFAGRAACASREAGSVRSKLTGKSRDRRRAIDGAFGARDLKRRTICTAGTGDVRWARTSRAPWDAGTGWATGSVWGEQHRRKPTLT